MYIKLKNTTLLWPVLYEPRSPVAEWQPKYTAGFTIQGNEQTLKEVHDRLSMPSDNRDFIRQAHGYTYVHAKSIEKPYVSHADIKADDVCDVLLFAERIFAKRYPFRGIVFKLISVERVDG